MHGSVSLWSLPVTLWVQRDAPSAELDEQLESMGAVPHQHLPGWFLPLSMDACSFVVILEETPLGRALGLEVSRAAFWASQMVLAGLPVEPRSHRALWERDQDALLTRLLEELRALGPIPMMHGDWDCIFDAEALLAGRKAIVYKSKGAAILGIRERLNARLVKKGLAETNRGLHIDSSGGQGSGH